MAAVFYRRLLAERCAGALFALATAYLVFVAPYWFPPARRLVSLSYSVGFNNRVAVLAVMAAVGVLTLVRRVLRSKDSGLELSPCSLASAGGVLLFPYFLVAIWYLVLTLAIYWLVAVPAPYYKL